MNVAPLLALFAVTACAEVRTPTAAPTMETGGLADPAFAIVTDPSTGSLTYTFDDLSFSCFMNATLPGPYEDLVFASDTYLAVCVAPNRAGFALLPSDYAAFLLGVTKEVSIQLPSDASAVSIDFWGLSSVPVTLNAYDAAGALLASAAATSPSSWATLNVASPGIRQVGIVATQADTYLDDLKVRYRRDPTGRDQCMDGGWAAFGFRNQGLCLRFVASGKDSRIS